eukprot:5066507-Pyramimonas_sp.AAC.1
MHAGRIAFDFPNRAPPVHGPTCWFDRASAAAVAAGSRYLAIAYWSICGFSARLARIAQLRSPSLGARQCVLWSMA